MNAKKIPDAYDSLIPSLVVKDATKAIDYYKKVFGATELMRLTYPGTSKVAHAELQIRKHVLMLGEECQGTGPRAPEADAEPMPCGVMIYVEDVDSTYNQALLLGGRSVMAPEEMFWGDRYAKFVDPFGHQWGVATHLRDVSQEECVKAMEEWGKEKAAA